MIWYRRECPMPNYLKGSQKIIYDALGELLAANRAPSVTALALCTGYSEPTVVRALQALRRDELIYYYQERPGQRATYAILAKV